MFYDNKLNKYNIPGYHVRIYFLCGIDILNLICMSTVK